MTGGEVYKASCISCGTEVVAATVGCGDCTAPGCDGKAYNLPGIAKAMDELTAADIAGFLGARFGGGHDDVEVVTPDE